MQPVETRSRLKFDDVVVDRGAMLVTRGGERIDLEPKAFDVLLHLAERPGQLVTKSELIASVWKGVAVTDHVLTRIIGQLRRGLGDAAREARYIETVPTRGYRFIAPVEADASEAAPDPRVTPSPEPGSRVEPKEAARWPRLVVAVLAAAVVAGAGGWFLARRAARVDDWVKAPAGLRQLTFAGALDVYPDFSPDGRFLAYASSASGSFEIEVRPMTPDARSQRVTNDSAGNIQPDWSPDGQRLAYHSIVTGGIWVVPALGGVPRRIVAVGASPAWSPDGRTLAFQSGEPATVEIGGTPPPSQLWVVGVEGDAPRPLTRGGHPVGAHTEPSWSPDGTRLAFVVRSVARAEIWSVAATGGEPVFVWACQGSCSRVVYEPGGRALIFAVSGQGYFRVAIDPASGEAAGPPTLLLAQRAGAAGQIALSPDGQSAVFTELVVKSNLDVLSLDPDGQPVGEPRPLTTTTGRATTPAFAPGGERIALVARREAMQVCLLSPSGGDITPLPVPAGFTQTFRPAWAPNGEILAIAMGADGAAAVGIDPDSRETRVLVPLGSSDVKGNAQFLAPSFFHDGQRMVFSRDDGDAVSIWAMDLSSRRVYRITPDETRATFPTPSPDGRLIAFERVMDGNTYAVVIPTGGGAARQLTSGRGLTWPHSWSSDGTRIFAAMRRGAFWSVGWVSVVTGETTVLTRLRTPHGYLRYPSISPAGDRVVYEHTETTGNIWQVPLWLDAGAGTR